jgi:hypothetical protein
VRSVTLKRPFTGGIVTDVPAHELSPNLSPYAQDGYSPSGVFRQRGGWEYDGTTADVADNLVGVYRSQFALADATRTVTSDDDGDLFLHNPAGAGTALYAGSVVYLPRCVYRDQLWFCGNGIVPALAYSGASAGSSDSVTVATVADQGIVARSAGGGTFGATTMSGQYQELWADGCADIPPIVWPRVLEVASTTSLTLEDMRASTADAHNYTPPTAYGMGFPCVSFYNAGTVSLDAGTNIVTGVGTLWTTAGVTFRDAVLVMPTDNDAICLDGNNPLSETQIEAETSKAYANSSYAMLRRMPFKDMAAHKGSLWGTGVAQYPNRVYVGPPNWNPAYPPGFTIPVDPSVAFESPNANDFLMDFIDVPASTDGDHNVAILQSSNPLLVLKRRAVYGVFGSFPTFTVEMIADGIGCIDIRSAQSYDEGQFWAGETGIFWYRGGQVTDLTAGRINREWRELTRDFDYGTNDYCSLAVVQGHLIVHITTNGGNTQRTYLCSLADGSWQSRVSNFTPRYMFTSRVPGEAEKCLAVSNARQGRVLDFAPALDGSGTAKDDAGTAPRLIAYTPEGIDGTSIEDDTRMIDLAIHANVYDVGAAGSTSMTVAAVTQDALTAGATATKNLSDIDSDTVDRIDRHYFRNVNRRGRRHQVRLEVDTLGTDATTTKVEVHQIDAAFRETRNRS